MTSLNVPVATMFERSTCLQVFFGRPGSRAKVDSARVEVDTDKELLHVSKDIMDSPELRALIGFDRGVRTWVKAHSVPTPYLRGGLYQVKLEAVPLIDEEMERRKTERAGYIESFMNTYDAIIDRARERLKSLFDQDDYPPPSRMRRAFKFETRYMTMGVPGNLEQISRTIFQREQEKSAARLREAEEEIKALLRNEFKDLVDGMVDLLTPGEDGKPKRWISARVNNVAEFLGTFQMRNIVDDAELTGVISQARALLANKDATALKESLVAREQIAKGFAEVKAALDPLAAVKPSRLISFDDDESAA
jgi:hypothetical protein